MPMNLHIFSTGRPSSSNHLFKDMQRRPTRNGGIFMIHRKVVALYACLASDKPTPSFPNTVELPYHADLDITNLYITKPSV